MSLRLAQPVGIGLDVPQEGGLEHVARTAGLHRVLDELHAGQALVDELGVGAELHARAEELDVVVAEAVEGNAGRQRRDQRQC